MARQTHSPYGYAKIPNAIGSFIIGVSPIGANGFDWSLTVISQYANSPRLLSIIESFAAAADKSGSIDEFFDKVWNVDTAEGWGLDVWGRIVGVSRVLPVVTKYFGFEEAGDLSATPFDVGPFYTGQSITQNFRLADDAYRQLIMAKAAANIWDGSIPGLNSILRLLFPGQIAYVTDGRDMTMTYTFEFTLNPVQSAIVNAIGILPRPTGVEATIESV